MAVQLLHSAPAKILESFPGPLHTSPASVIRSGYSVGSGDTPQTIAAALFPIHTRRHAQICTPHAIPLAPAASKLPDTHPRQSFPAPAAPEAAVFPVRAVKIPGTSKFLPAKVCSQAEHISPLRQYKHSSAAIHHRRCVKPAGSQIPLHKARETGIPRIGPR